MCRPVFFRSVRSSKEMRHRSVLRYEYYEIRRQGILGLLECRMNGECLIYLLDSCGGQLFDHRFRTRPLLDHIRHHELLQSLLLISIHQIDKSFG